MTFPNWVAPFADGWYPKLSPDGKFLLCGSAHAQIVEIVTKRAFALTGAPQIIAFGWLNSAQAVVSADLTGTDKHWKTYRVDVNAPGVLLEIGPALSFAGAGGNVWAGGDTQRIWAGDPAGHGTVLYPVMDDPPPGYAATVDEQGFIAGNVDVNTHEGKVVVWKNGRRVRVITPAVPPSRTRCGAGGYVGYGYYGPSWLNTPDNKNVEVTVTPDRAESPALAFLHRGAVWLATTSDRGIYLRPYGVRDRAITIDTPAIDVSVVSLGDTFLVASQTDKGKLTITTVPAATALQPVAGPPPPKPKPVVPLNRACWVGFINTREHAPTPGNCELWTVDLVLRDHKDRNIAQYVAGVPETDLRSLNARIALAKTHHPELPVLAYWPRGLWAGPLPIGADWLAIDGTQKAGESDAVFEVNLRAQCKRHPKPVPVGQCYTNIAPGLVQELTHLVPIYSAIMHDFPNAPAVVAFSGYDRQTGYNDHPEVHALWTDWFATAHTPVIPVPPDPPHPEPPPMPTQRTVGLLTWIKKFITNERGGDDTGTVIANDRTDEFGHVLPQQVFAWQEMHYIFRPGGKVTIQGVSGRFWCAEHANTTTYMDPTAVITCSRPNANLNADSWELFDYVNNGDGTVSFKSQFGFYVCCEADGRIVCNRTAIGEYEKFIELAPGSVVPAPPAPGGPLPRIVSQPNTPIFRTEDGSPWRMKGVSDFKGGEVFRTGGDVRPFANAYPGANTHRVFAYTEGPNWTDPTWESPTPQQCVDYVRTMNNIGRYVWWVLLTSSNPARRAAALDQIAAFKAAGNLGLFLQGANEPERQHDGIKIETAFMHDALAASGYPWDNGYIDTSALHRGTFADQHSKRDGEWVRRSHDAMDIYTLPNDAPAGSVALKVQVILGEPPKLEDVGGANVVDWKGYFGSGSFFGAGVVFHSMTGKFSQLPTDAERRMWAAALEGMNAFPADATLGAYSRIDGDGLRTYIKGNCMTRIRPNSPNPPQSGWTSLEADHVLYKR